MRFGILVSLLHQSMLNCLKFKFQTENKYKYLLFLSFPGGSVVKNLPATAGEMGSIPELGTSRGEGNGNWLQYSWLEKPMASPWGRKELDTTKWLTVATYFF